MDQTSFTPTCDVVSCCAMPSASLSVVLISFASRLTHPARTHVGMGVLRCSRLPLRQLKIVFRSKPAHCSAALPASVESILGRGKLRSSYIYECRIYLGTNIPSRASRCAAAQPAQRTRTGACAASYYCSAACRLRQTELSYAGRATRTRVASQRACCHWDAPR